MGRAEMVCDDVMQRAARPVNLASSVKKASEFRIDVRWNGGGRERLCVRTWRRADITRNSGESEKIVQRQIWTEHVACGIAD